MPPVTPSLGSSGARATESGGTCAELLAVATPRLYLDHPFRRLGLPVLSSSREISRRTDELKLSIELGTSSTPWAFASETELTTHEIREAAQKLKSPRERLIYEFFWFWPENYPLEGDDPALGVLAKGETAPAVEAWVQAADAGSRVARHNLAVYHHLLVLDWECLLEHEEARLPAVWPQTLEYWLNIADDEPLWELLRARVEKIADPQLPVGFVAEIRASLPAAVSKINAALLINDAEGGRTERVSLHASLIAQIHRDATGVRRTLENSAAPVTRRIDGYVVAARQQANDESLPALAAALNLVRNGDGDLRLVATLCGREEAYTELSSSVADAALACLVAHQRRTKDDQGCLPLLVYLLNMAVTPELRQRLEETYQVIRGNIFAAATDPASDETNEHALEHRLIAEHIIPQLDRLELNAAGRQEFTHRLAEWLGQLAITARQETEPTELVHAMLTTALALPCEPELHTRLEAQLAEVALERQQRESILQLERGEVTLVLDAEQITLDGQTLTPFEITGWRHGIGAEGSPTIAWCSSEQVVVVDSNHLLAGENAASDSVAILAAFQRFVVPGLATRLLEAIHEESIVTVGEISLSRAGVAFESTSDLTIEAAERWVPYHRIQHRIEDGFLVVSDVENPTLTSTQALAEVWNAAIIGLVIDALAQESNSVSS